MQTPRASTLRHQDQLEAYNAGWNAGRWNEPRNCPFYDRERAGLYVEGYNDGKRYAAKAVQS